MSLNPLLNSRIEEQLPTKTLRELREIAETCCDVNFEAVGSLPIVQAMGDLFRAVTSATTKK